MGAQPSVTELIDKAASLDTVEFDNFFNKVLTLRAQRDAPVLTKEAADLLKKNKSGLSGSKMAPPRAAK